MSPGLI
jgi:hypothetical protein